MTAISTLCGAHNSFRAITALLLVKIAIFGIFIKYFSKFTIQQCTRKNLYFKMLPIVNYNGKLNTVMHRDCARN